MSNPESGYRQTTLLNLGLKKIASDYAKKEIGKQVNKQLGNIANRQISRFAGRYNETLNKAVASARSASEKLSGALGGRLSSSINSAVGNKLGELGSVVGNKITNMATGAITQGLGMAKNKLAGALGGALGGSAIGSVLGGSLGGALSSLTDDAAKNLINAQVAPAFLTTQPTDDLMAQDAYGISDNGILNKLGETAGSALASKLDEFRGSGSGIASDLLDMVVDKSKSWALSKDGLAGRIVDTLGGRMSALNGLSDRFKETLTNGLGLPEDTFSIAKVAIGEAISRIDTRGNSDVRNVLNLIGQVTGNSSISQYFDVGSTAALMSGLMREAIVLGVDGAVKALVDSADGENREAALIALEANIITAFENSDLDTIGEMIDLLGVNRVLSVIPDGVTVLLANYEFPLGIQLTNYATERNELLAVIERINPNWDKAERGGELISNLTPFATMSEDARTLFLRSDQHMVHTLVAKTFDKPVNVTEGLKAAYPNVRIFN